MIEIDTRPFAEPDCLGYRRLEQCDYATFAREMSAAFPDCRWGRFTIVAPELPKPPYPDGWYFEGWSVDPAEMDPPHREAPFNYPLTDGGQHD